jgi:hypothetical protein
MSDSTKRQNYDELYSTYLKLDVAARAREGGEPGNTGKTVKQFIDQLVAFTPSEKIMNVIPF